VVYIMPELNGAQPPLIYMHNIIINIHMKNRTTLILDDELLEEARKLTGLKEKTAVVHEGLRALISRESARQLAELGGTMPDLKPIPRRRPPPDR
jgi:Arc/MetJ family transcription regulator